MSCKSCGSTEVVERYLCLPCVKDYRYNLYRKVLHKRQAKENKFLSHEGPRWSREEKKLIKKKIKEALLSGMHTEIRARKVAEIFEVNRTFTNKILQELQREGLIVKKGVSHHTYYIINKEVKNE